MTKARQQKDRPLQVVDLARTLAILPVLALHLKPTLPLPPPVFRWAWDHFQRNGGYGVTLFFVISGFLITRTLDLRPGGVFRSSWKDFYVRRAGRILPVLSLDILIGLVFVFWLQDDSKKFAYCFKLPRQPGDPSFWIPLIFFFFNWARCFWAAGWGTFGGYWGVLWSLAVEEQFYIFYPLILRWAKNVRNLMWLLALVILAGTAWRWFVFTQGSVSGPDWKWGSFGCFDGLAVGVGLYFVERTWGSKLARKPPISAWICAAGGLVMAVTYSSVAGAEGMGQFWGPTLMEAGLAFFLLGGLNCRTLESKSLRVLALPGRYSYGMYLFHIAVLYFLNHFLWNLNIGVAYGIFVVVTTGVAAFSFHYFETPVNHWIRRTWGAEKRSSRA